ncbi:uncharacterized protein N7484_009931 [Penicillium longicatenatum]|uniref:uncharacterized protein n=1 Tax=Penicillium longicatenatum TaxID=1561947 RepID=UPI002547224B|nr:uncharacterized protein N7484_009931 [Penicillium longicatenatum]KAJ5636618.1 hypothetical protein N7484_009931 [Penicillium longicatenatum]
MRPQRDASYASNRLTRTAHLSRHLLSSYNKPDTQDNKLPTPPKPEIETPRNVREPSIEAEPLSTTDAESSDSDAPQRPKDDTKRQVLGEKLAAGVSNGSSSLGSNCSSTNRNTSIRKPLGRTSSIMTADDDDDNPYFSLSSQSSYKRARQTGYGSKSKSTSFSSIPTSSARSITTPGKTARKSKTGSAQSSTKNGKSKKRDSSSESEPEVGFKVPMHIDTPSPRKSKPSTNVKKGRPSPEFKMPPVLQPDPFPTSSLGTSSRDAQLNAYDLSSDSTLSTPLSSPSSSIMEALQHEAGFESDADRASPDPPHKALCPMCNAEVDPEILRQFQAQPNQRLREQQRFCTSHKQDTATKEWEAQGYPEINWDTFEQRLEKHFPDMDQYLDPQQPSYYRNILESAQQAGKSLRLTLNDDGIETISCGYYGTKGAQKMLYVVMERFGVRLRRLAKDDALVAKVGVAGYAQSVIVPELATRLIKEDMGVDASVARGIMRESIEIGQKLNPQLDDVVPVEEDDY